MRPGILSNVRILDLTRVWSGPLATRMLADFGAQVIKIGDPRVPVARTSGLFNKLNRNKLSLALLLDNPSGKDIFMRLVEISDVVVENFRPRVMVNFGLTYDALREIKPDIIMMAMSGFGSSGEYADFPAFGSSVETMTGITSLMGYPGGAPMTSAVAYPDPIAALNGASALMTALWQRKRSGRGQLIDLALSEGPVTQIGEFILAYSRNKKQPELVGNGHDKFAPYGCYPSNGEDKWITICVQSEKQWQALCGIMSSPAWASGGKFSDQQSRHEHRDELDTLVGEWTLKHEAQALMRLLQERGIAAGAVVNAKELLEDPHLNERGYFAEIDEPDIGNIRYPGQAIRMSATPLLDWKPAPRLGEHSRRILEDLLQLSEDIIYELEAQGVVGSWPAE